MKTFDQLIKFKTWEIDLYRTKIMPFPGKYPTRWRVSFYAGIKCVHTHVCKPNSLQQQIALNLAKKLGAIDLMEFDRGGVIRRCYRATPRKTFEVQWTHPTLTYAYYPWSPTGEFFSPWWGPIYHKRMRFEGRDFFVYSPYQTMLDAGNVERLREYRRWLRGSAVLK